MDFLGASMGLLGDLGTCDTLFLSSFLSISVCFGIGATIRTCCLLLLELLILYKLICVEISLELVALVFEVYQKWIRYNYSGLS